MYKLGDRLLHLVDGSMQSPIDKEILREDLNRIGPIVDIVSGWLPSGKNSPEFKYFQADEAEFANIPLGLVSFSDQALVAETASAATVTLDNPSYYNIARYMNVDATGTKLVSLVSHGFFFTGRAVFDANATGDRRVTVYAYNIDDTLLYTADLACIRATATQATIVSFNGQYPLKPGQYLKFSIWQDSGLTLSTNVFYIRVFIVR
jgi:hypothetical protein